MKVSTNNGLSHWNYDEKQRDDKRNIKHVNFVPK